MKRLNLKTLTLVVAVIAILSLLTMAPGPPPPPPPPCEGVCPSIDPCVEEEIRALWAACPSCDEARNHGQYVSCRANIVSGYVEMGLVDEEGSSCLINPEARSDCPPRGR